MTDLLIRLFLRSGDPSDPRVRDQCGFFAGIFGIALNLLLAVAKLLVGILSASLAITADALNNFSDAASSIVTAVGFRLASQRPDAEHPFGHGRAEYLAGLIVSLLILLVGVETLKVSVEKIITPEAVAFSWIAVAVLAVSIAVKLWMSYFQKTLSRRIQSVTLSATAADSLSDVAATGAVLAGTLVGHFFALHLDGWIGIVVALFIIRAGFLAARDTLNPLLGAPPDPALVKEIYAMALEKQGIFAIHDLVIHDYGPGRAMMSFHAEVSADADLMQTHDMIDQLERELRGHFGIETCIHMDPIETNDAHVNAMRVQVARMVRNIDPQMTIHDFRMTSGPHHTNLIFDIVVPYDFQMSDDALRAAVAHAAKELDKSYYTVTTIDRLHISQT
ncbi:MAG: cation diffusion facilitator family transporter [Oscillospiraceae bacterium]|nr:cation diffusion facilitator family transporter [Oscillospiraceae bacterium]